jgi:hypothetical protein
MRRAMRQPAATLSLSPGPLRASGQGSGSPPVAMPSCRCASPAQRQHRPKASNSRNSPVGSAVRAHHHHMAMRHRRPMQQPAARSAAVLAQTVW